MRNFISLPHLSDNLNHTRFPVPKLEISALFLFWNSHALHLHLTSHLQFVLMLFEECNSISEALQKYHFLTFLNFLSTGVVFIRINRSILEKIKSNYSNIQFLLDKV